MKFLYSQKRGILKHVARNEEAESLFCRFIIEVINHLGGIFEPEL